MTDLIDRLVRDNPLLAHGPRTHATGVETAPAAAPAPRRRLRRPADVDAPRVHLGPAYRYSA